MKEYNGFETKEEYLRYTKKSLYKNGLTCMACAAIVIVLLFILGLNPAGEVMIMPAKMFWFIQRYLRLALSLVQ